MDTNPRIYYLCPWAAGPINGWSAWIDHAQRLAFNTIWVGDLSPRAPNPSHPWAVTCPGGIASELDQDGDPAIAFKIFIELAHDAGMHVWGEINPVFVSSDADVVAQHPEWIQRHPDGTASVPRLPSLPGSSEVIPAPKLATLLPGSPADASEFAEYWLHRFCALLNYGLDGLVFRCAARLPSEYWHRQIRLLKRYFPDAVFVADALGASWDKQAKIADSGFDFLLSSFCWWNLHDHWFFELEDRLGGCASTLAFPEMPGGARLASMNHISSSIVAEAKFRYGLAATIGGGVIMPMGYEFGSQNVLGNVTLSTEYEELEAKSYDLQDYVGGVNHTLDALPVQSAPARRISSYHSGALIFRRCQNTDVDWLLLVNPKPESEASVLTSSILTSIGARRIEDHTPKRSPVSFYPDGKIALEPLSFRFAALFDETPVQTEMLHGSLSEDSIGDRIVINNITPLVAEGLYPAKRNVGDRVVVEADIFCDGHGVLSAALSYRASDETDWRSIRMMPQGNDRWRAVMVPSRVGYYEFRIEAWQDAFLSWREECIKKRQAGQVVSLELAEGFALIDSAYKHANSLAKGRLEPIVKRLQHFKEEPDAFADEALSEATAETVSLVDITPYLAQSPIYRIVVDRPSARYASWYELFPRSLGGDAQQHGTFRDVIDHLSYIRHLGFDVLYMPPIHPIGETNRKGRNNTLNAYGLDPGSPWAIGNTLGGHTAIHPELGTLADFHELVTAAKSYGIEIALDFAIQCSPDHPWITEHPEWFAWRPDGSLKHAENPPKKYEDIVNVDFYSEDKLGLWRALRDVLAFWIDQGISIFRVDNPHTKPFPFWSWLIDDIKKRYPEVIFLSEAFTRPKIMHRLAQIGFTQSYTYFTWRHSKQELTDYILELSEGSGKEYLRPNFFVNTPDINPFFLQTGGRPAFMQRAALAATLSSLWGMYSGFELCEAEAVPGREEYQNSEKYEIKIRDFQRTGNIVSYIHKLNRIRHENPALHYFTNIRFHWAGNDAVLFYAKATEELDNILWCFVNLDPHHSQVTEVILPLSEYGLGDGMPIEAEDLFTGRRWSWYGAHQKIYLDPADNPILVARITPPAA